MSRVKLTVAVCAAVLVAGILVYAGLGGAGAAGVLPCLRSEIAAIPPPASASLVRTDEFSKAGTARVSMFFRDASSKEDIRSHYDQVLAERHWLQTAVRETNETD